MNERKNVAIGKIGKSVKFKGIKIAQGAGADVTWFSLISRMNPTWHFYFIGPNELNKLSEAEYEYIFPNKNVHSVYKVNRNKIDYYEDMLNDINEQGLKFDFGLFFLGLHADKSIQNFFKKEDGSYYQLLNAFSNYCGSYTYIINKTKMPWYTMSEDARYITYHVKDLTNYERLSFSQINGVFTSHNCIPDETYDTITKDMPWTHHTVPAIYSGIEKIFLNGIKDTWKEDIDIDRKLKSTNPHIIILSNGCGTGQIDVSGGNSSRYPTYKKWIIDNFKDTEYDNTMIYGSWDKDIYEKEPRIQNRLLVDLKEEIADAKYTLVYSQIPGFVTIKPWEMITIGLIPFLHPDYDCYNLLQFPEYLYVKDEQDFLNKVRELDANPDKYIALLNECFNMIKPEDRDGSKLNNFVFGTIAEDLGFEYEKPEHGVKSIFNRFDKDMLNIAKIEKPKPKKKKQQENTLF